ncbi:hypothetical protein [Flavobacterium tegetincola]|uniref:hypothetical protein n=1 Tax=Flavobacterium tegetincola TaxID=150172 RepID=UPI0012FA70C4|nr:hypothetical protein [Flavobacterium tegetincola]
MKLKLYIILSLVLGIVSCKSNKEDMNNVIAIYNDEDFSCLKNTFISIRGGVNNDTIILLISKSDNGCSPYIVTVNNQTKEIAIIDGNLPKRDCNGYFTDEEIGNYVKCFFKYNFQVLSVDLEGNVFINPNQENPPSLLRVEKDKEPKDIKYFKLYKDNWYVRK